MIALVAAETTNQLVAVELPSGRIVKRLRMPVDPQNVAICGGTAAVVSVRAGAVTLVDAGTLKVRRILRDFDSPHIPACSSDGRYVYVTDDARGQLAVIRNGVVRRLFVGHGAHHMAEDGLGNRLWIALGERARSIAVVDVSSPTQPRLVGHVDPQGAAHDLAFSPRSTRVWVTYDDRPEVGIFSAATGRLVRRLPAGSAPQHVAFGSPGRAYVSSGNDGTMRMFSSRTGRPLRVFRTTYGSFNLATYGSFVTTSSLYRGTLMDFDESGRRWLQKQVAPSARDVAVTTVP
jgi:DNA-binding beta-propeller fold protein YncE